MSDTAEPMMLPGTFAARCCGLTFGERTDYSAHMKADHRGSISPYPLTLGMRPSRARQKPAPLTPREREWLGAWVYGSVAGVVGQVWCFGKDVDDVWVAFPTTADGVTYDGPNVLKRFTLARLARVEVSEEQPELVA